MVTVASMKSALAWVGLFSMPNDLNLTAHRFSLGLSTTGPRAMAG